MITVNFNAPNLFALRDQIIQFLEDAGFETAAKTNLATSISTITQKTVGEQVKAVAEQMREHVASEPVTPEPEASAPVAPEPEVSEPVTFEQVRVATLQLASKRGREAVMEVLAPYKVSRSSEVPEALWGELITKLEAAQNG